MRRRRRLTHHHRRRVCRETATLGEARPAHILQKRVFRLDEEPAEEYKTVVSLPKKIKTDAPRLKGDKREKVRVCVRL